MMSNRRREKIRAQVKSRFYYLFWGLATFSVVAGQLYVGSGYRMYARSLMRILDAVDVEINRGSGPTPYPTNEMPIIR